MSIHLLCDTLTSSATFHTPDVTKQSWKLRCPAQKKCAFMTHIQAFGIIKSLKLKR